MKTKELIVDGNKKIYVFDDVFDLEWRTVTFDYIKKSLFSTGYRDTEENHEASHLYFCSSYGPSDIEHLKIIENIKDKELLGLLKNKEIYRCIVNCSVPTDTNFVHSHSNTTFLYYANPFWKEGWAGETLFYNESVSEIVYASVYKPGRVILFDGSIPHSLRPQSRMAPHHRYTLSMFLDKGKKL
jgi:hypothetical protein